jgi:CRP-like cAMP-binding protein
MKNVGPRANILKASDELKNCLESVGVNEHVPSERVLFREDGGSAGVVLVRKGKVLMSVTSLPKLDRVFSEGSLLGLPATFTGHPYSLTAVAVGECDIVRVAREEFLQLMRDRTDLCKEATEMLGQEVTFIQAALVEKRRQMAVLV